MVKFRHVQIGWVGVALVGGALLGCEDGRTPTDVDAGLTDSSQVSSDAMNAVDAVAACEADCEEPFRCGPSWDPLETSQSCNTTHLGPTSCDGSAPGDQVVLNDDDNPIHWAVGSCIPVTFGLPLRSLESEISSAVLAWNEVSCSQLCLQEPFMSNTPLDIERRERRIHIDIGELTAGTAYYERISGRAFAADIGIEENLVEQVGVGDMLSLLMSALGFIEPPGGLGSRPERPTAGRVEVICQIYGNPTLCDASFRAP